MNGSLVVESAEAKGLGRLDGYTISTLHLILLPAAQMQSDTFPGPPQHPPHGRRPPPAPPARPLPVRISAGVTAHSSTNKPVHQTVRDCRHQQE